LAQANVLERPFRAESFEDADRRGWRALGTRPAGTPVARAV